jgi:hypothetical protein
MKGQKSARVEANMPEQQVESILPDLAKAFSDAVFAFGVWSSEQNGRVIPIKRRGFYSINSVCDFVHRFTAPLPKLVLQTLRSYMQNHPDDDKLKAELDADCSYATGARCLRKMMERQI